MRMGKVIGRVWATQKDPQLHGLKLYLIQPMKRPDQPMGRPLLAVDVVGANEGDLVFWVSAREGTYALPDRRIPSDASIVGLVDSVNSAGETEIEASLKRWRVPGQKRKD